LRVATDNVVDSQWTGALATFQRLSLVDSTLRNLVRDSTLMLAAQARFGEITARMWPKTDIDAHTARVVGYAYEHSGMPDRALEYYATMAAGMPNDPRAYLIYGRGLVEAKRLAEAIRVFARATDSLESDPD